MTLGLPTRGETRLVLGNSVYGKHFWEENVYGLAFYRSTLADQDIAAHVNRWSQERNFSFAEADKPVMLFLFADKS